MILQINSQQSPTLECGGVHHVGDVVSLILSGLRKPEGETRSQAVACNASQRFGVTVTQTNSVLA